MADPAWLNALKRGGSTAERLMLESDEYNLSIGSPKFKQRLAQQDITLRQTPLQFVGAYTARLIADVTNDGTRGLWWRYNHPLAIANKIAEKAIGTETAKSLGPVKAGLLMASIVAPATAVAGTYDITNIGQQFRPKGFTQQYTEEGTDDRRETTQPTQEIFERFFLGRQGQPLKYETAKKEIPDLTPERYGNYMRNFYHDPGLMGIVKATPENLQGVPEARMLGYPISIPMVAGIAGGAAAVAVAGRTGAGPASFGKLIAAGLAGSLGGITAGNITNEVIAAGNRPKLPTTYEYENQG